VQPLVNILNGMNCSNGLPKTILYSLNSKDNLVLSSIPHCFPEDGIAGKLQFGPAWWFCDNKEEIIRHLKSIANQGMLADFVGMLTDSRSFLSYVRHDYFRRILCNLIGELVEDGEFEADDRLLKEITAGICYRNIVNYLGLEDVE
jgi:glucuronate isomerase